MRILVVDDEKLVRTTIQRQLQTKHSLVTADSAATARELLEKYPVDLVFLDLQLDSSEEPAGLSLLKEIRSSNPNTIVIVMTGLEDSILIERCFQLGAADYFFKPIIPEKLELVIQKAKVVQQLLRQNQTLRARMGQSAVTPISLTTKSHKFQKVLDQLKKLKGKHASVLLLGETGVGKDVLAQYLWSIEEDPCRPFIPVNCAAITASVAESELFGHKKGSFTGATENRIGKFEQADGGDIFLDEVATLSMETQQKLLRVLNNGEITPVGQNIPKKVQCRVIAATNEDLNWLVKEKKFREDLLFRLNQITIKIPSLRERSEDILDLCESFLLGAGYSMKSLSKDAKLFIVNYSWPGNVRELRATIEASAILANSNIISREEIEAQIKSTSYTAITPDSKKAINEPILRGNFQKLVKNYEMQLIQDAIEKAGTETDAARLLGIPRTTLRSIRDQLRKI